MSGKTRWVACILMTASVVFGSAEILAQCSGVNPRIRKIDANVSSRIQTYMEYLPLSYQSSPSTTYSLLIYWPGLWEITLGPGGGECALKSPLLDASLPKEINQGNFPEVVYDNNNQPHSFIVLAPMVISTAGMNSVTETEAIINWAIANYRVNPNRVYLTGISMGAGICLDFLGSSLANARRIAATNLQATCPNSGPNSFTAGNIANGDVPLWGIHINNDWVCGIEGIQSWASAINSIKPGLAFVTPYDVGQPAHAVFNLTYKPTYRPYGKNVYEWLVQYSRTGGVSPPPAFASSMTTGNWNSPSTWSCNCVPSANMEVTIKAGQTVTIPANMGPVQVKKLTLEAGARLNVYSPIQVVPN